jgi:protein-glucosylgalactosylhydroxylysine glucosidase
MAAFLQSLIYGFAGFRIRPDQLECHDPQPPPGQTSLILTNFYYLGSNITFTITADKTVIKVLAVNSAYPLILRRNQTGAVEESLTAGNETRRLPTLARVVT